VVVVLDNDLGVVLDDTQQQQQQQQLEQQLEQLQAEQSMLGIRATLRIAAIFSPIWFVANYAFNLSLTQTSVASSTVISATSSLWTLLLGVIIGVEQYVHVV
jgi:solute carrier family 35, member F5